MPSKIVVCPQHASPDAVTATKRRLGRRFETLARDHDNLEVLDLAPPLRDARAHGPLFHVRDEALTARGAFFAHRALVKAAAVRGLSPLPLERCALAESHRAAPTGLEDLPVVGHDEDVGEPVVPAPALEADITTLTARRMPAGAHLEIDGVAAPRVYERLEAPHLPRVLLLGDDSALPMVPWIAETTSRLVVLRTSVAPLEQIELELPHVVLYVVDERGLGVAPRPVQATAAVVSPIGDGEGSDGHPASDSPTSPWRSPRRLGALAALLLLAAAGVALTRGDDRAPRRAPSTARTATSAPGLPRQGVDPARPLRAPLVVDDIRWAVFARSLGDPFVVDGVRWAVFAQPDVPWTTIAQRVTPPVGQRWLFISSRARNLARPGFDPSALSFVLADAGGRTYTPVPGVGTTSESPPVGPLSLGMLGHVRLAFFVSAAATGFTLHFASRPEGGVPIAVDVGNPRPVS